MTRIPDNHPDLVALESLVDTHGLCAVVEVLETICYGKAVHLADNLQDRGAALRWERAGKRLDGLLAALSKIQLEG